MKKAFALFCLGLGTLMLTSCGIFSSREVTVSPASSSEARRYFSSEMLNPDGLSLESMNFLRGNLLQDDFSKNPLQTLQKLKSFFEISKEPKYLLIAADLCHYLALSATPDDAIRYHLSAFEFCGKTMAAQKKSTSEDEHFDYATTQLSLIYNDACCGIFNYLKERNILEADSITLNGIDGKKFVLTKPRYNFSVPREVIEDFSLCSGYSVSNLMQVNRRPGLGVPLVARVKHRQVIRSLNIPKGLTMPVTLLIYSANCFAETIELRLTFFDTSKQEYLISPLKEKWPLALDFSTPLACYFNAQEERNLLAVMLDPLGEEKKSGLMMLEPYQPHKIPVVFIHGLMSGPSTWMQMINSLKCDPVIRQRYQFWFYSYSSGSPVIVSAGNLHRALLAAQKELCTTPEATKNFNQMVLVGHSMGGLVTRTMLQKDPRYLLETIARCSWKKMTEKLQPDELKLLENNVVFPALPFVHRAVFMAVPHRGAAMAQMGIARFGSRIIKLPTSLLSQKDKIFEIMQKLHPEQTLFSPVRNQFYTGIDNLDPDNHFIRALGTSKLKDDLTYHCIMGNHKKDGVPGGSDGVVPYSSSHLNGAASELIVKSDHSVHRRPAAIMELLRILRLHLQEKK